jgi:putative membrane protein
LQRGEARWTSTQLRLWNEVSTLLLFAIVFLIVLKNTLSMLWGMLGLVGLFVILLIAIKVYKKYRTK